MNLVKMTLQIILFASLVAVLSACENSGMDSMPVPDAPPRQFDQVKLALGKQVYQQHCAACHGLQAEGAADWRKRDADGHYPAPPLNGSGHAWHHSIEVLTGIIKNGSPEGKGKMPAWDARLSDEQIDAVIAWFQSGWPQPVYDAWYEMQQRGR